VSGSANYTNSFAVIRTESGDISDARLIWADRQFLIIFDGVGLGASPFADGLPAGISSAGDQAAIGTEIAVEGRLFGRPAPAAARLVALGEGVFAVSWP
jgi:hypothetical protein